MPHFWNATYDNLGLTYLYFDSESNNVEKFLNINETRNNPLFHTTLPLFYSDYSNKYLTYNDQPPPWHNHSFIDGAHAKGLIYYNNYEGFWIQHSLPHFIDISKEFYIPHNGKVNGQTFLCISLETLYTKIIVRKLLKIGIHVTNTNIDISKMNHSGIGIYNFQVYSIFNGIKFDTSFKSPNYHIDIYDAYLNNHMFSTLNVQTWQNGRGRMHSNCSIYFNVMNINKIKMMDQYWFSTKDHSKWAYTINISNVKSINIFCSCDLNRQTTQMHRGGGCVCFENQHLVEFMKQSTLILDPCDLV
ncbi:hypothetical protein A3Q56_04624 [Intoshia linei]|uniref:Uncharacterized protein n=1 Tax=Intoshia linei TaxID=1819745 RepID=A0A177B1Q4_9BILA|nr:hypothetical protein A3Q56_04624 [Intoshia linei]